MKKYDLTGKKFNYLLVLEKCKERKDKKVMWKCQCDCGKITYVHTSNLVRGKVKSCGCYKVNQIIKRSTTHKQRHTDLYEVWKSIKNRCLCPTNKSYFNYGGRGITICEDWKDNFQAFYDWSYANGYKKGLSIDRVNNNGNYEPSNCRWATRHQQNNNTRVNHFLTYNNETHTIAQWSKLLGIKYATLQNRIYNGWSIERAFTQPIKI